MFLRAGNDSAGAMIFGTQVLLSGVAKAPGSVAGLPSWRTSGWPRFFQEIPADFGGGGASAALNLGESLVERSKSA